MNYLIGVPVISPFGLCVYFFPFYFHQAWLDYIARSDITLACMKP